jgi:CRP-like cAMP-binding protein
MKPMAMAETTALLGAVPGLAEVGQEPLTELAELFVARSYPEGAWICEEGAVAEDIFVLLQGQAEVVKLGTNGRRYAVATLGPGVFFGLVGVVAAARRTASVRAQTAVELLSLPTAVARELVEADDVHLGSPIRRALLVALSRQLWSASSTAMSLAVDAGLAQPLSRSTRGGGPGA